IRRRSPFCKPDSHLSKAFSRYFGLCVFGQILRLWSVTVDMFKQEIGEALKAYDKYIVCVDKTVDDADNSLRSLMEKAIKAYEHRGPHLRHGIALDRQVTIILSQTESDRPLCGIYFNLSSPYQKKAPNKPAKSAS